MTLVEQVIEITKPKLMSFRWFAWAYGHWEAVMDRLRSIEAWQAVRRQFHTIVARVRRIKAQMESPDDSGYLGRPVAFPFDTCCTICHVKRPGLDALWPAASSISWRLRRSAFRARQATLYLDQLTPRHQHATGRSLSASWACSAAVQGLGGAPDVGDNDVS